MKYFVFARFDNISHNIFIGKKNQLFLAVCSCPVSYKFNLETAKNSHVEQIFYHCVSLHTQCTLHNMIYEFLQFLRVSFMYVQVDMEMDCVV